MSVTKEQWAQIEEQLSYGYGRVELKADGFDVVATIMNVDKLRQGIVVYVNGFIKGEWVNGEAEEARKFHRESKSFVWGVSERKEWLKLSKMRHLSKEDRKRYADNAERTNSIWKYDWTSAKSFCRHIRKTCTDIEVVKVGY
ncbi:MAG: hypothetical protein RIR18_423 [Pseudomonadota bacterium]